MMTLPGNPGYPDIPTYSAVAGPRPSASFFLGCLVGLLATGMLTALGCRSSESAASNPANPALQATAPQAPITPAAGPQALHVITFNIRYGTAKDGLNHWYLRRAMVFDLIKRHNPDILGVQEALRFQIDEILSALPEYAFVGVGRDDAKDKGEFSAILYRRSRFTPASQGTFWLSDTPETPGSMTWGNKIPRVCSWARFQDQVSGRHFYVYNAHLDHQSQPSRLQSANLIMERIGARSPQEPFIITGDFNAGESNPALATFLNGTPIKTRDTFRVLNPDEKAVGTFMEFKGHTTTQKIDYILTPEGMAIHSAAILHDNVNGRYPSDHFPVSAVISLPPAQ